MVLIGFEGKAEGWSGVKKAHYSRSFQANQCLSNYPVEGSRDKIAAVPQNRMIILSGK